MKVNSENLYEYINELATNQKVKFKVYYDDSYVTEVLWNGTNFEWETGTLTSEAFFNPLYDFEVIEEDKKIAKLITTAVGISDSMIIKSFTEIALKINEIIDKINKEE